MDWKVLDYSGDCMLYHKMSLFPDVQNMYLTVNLLRLHRFE